ncbi:hypothetical protein B0H11DRAFT_62994 [Mycena galericulata]|nr:hypothetical protein B0H11DRAFT_62994 [Mycena galericulata]
MRFTSAFTALAASTLAAVSASPFQDWKYSLGWDGTVLNPVVIGTPTSPNVVRSALVPRTPGGVYICTGLGFTCTSGSLAPAGTRSSRSTCIDLAPRGTTASRVSVRTPARRASPTVRTAVTKPSTSGSLPTLEMGLEGSQPLIPGMTRSRTLCASKSHDSRATLG